MVASLFNLEADPEALRTAASAWRTLATEVDASWRDLAEVRGRVVGAGWSGDAADSYGGHATRFGGDIAESGLAMSSIASALESAADRLTEAQELLARRLNQVLSSVFTSNEELSETIEAAEDDARLIRDVLDEELRSVRDDLMEANNVLRLTGERWQPVADGHATGWVPPPEAAGEVGAIQVGDELVLNIPDGAYPPGMTINLRTDPVTGEQVVEASTFGSVIELYRAPGGAKLTIRTGPGEDQIQLDRGATVIAGAGDDTIYQLGGSSTILGLGGNDMIDSDPAYTPDWISGGPGMDIAEGVSHNSVFLGGAGMDEATGRGTHARLSGGDGGDWLSSYEGGSTLDGGAGNDHLYGGDGHMVADGTIYPIPDVLRGGPGADSLQSNEGGGGQSADTVDGGGGRDHAWVDPRDRLRDIETSGGT